MYLASEETSLKDTNSRTTNREGWFSTTKFVVLQLGRSCQDYISWLKHFLHQGEPPVDAGVVPLTLYLVFFQQT